jgi:hypothetical protein
MGMLVLETESANVKVQNTFHGRNNIMCNKVCKYRTVAKVYNIQTRFVLGT